MFNELYVYKEGIGTKSETGGKIHYEKKLGDDWNYVSVDNNWIQWM